MRNNATVQDKKQRTETREIIFIPVGGLQVHIHHDCKIQYSLKYYITGRIYKMITKTAAVGVLMSWQNKRLRLVSER